MLRLVVAALPLSPRRSFASRLVARLPLTDAAANAEKLKRWKVGKYASWSP